MNSLQPHHFILIGLALFLLGSLLSWLITRAIILSKAKEGIGRLEERLRSEVQNQKDLSLRLEKIELLHTSLQTKESAAQRKIGEQEVQLREEKEAAKEKQALLEKSEQRLGETFKSLSVDALRKTQDEFLKLAGQTLKAQEEKANLGLEQRHKAVEQLVKPVNDSLEKVKVSIGEIEKQRENAYASLKQQVITMTESQLNLQKETSKLVKALRQPTGRGQWGEMQLQRVVEMAGMQEHCDFHTQSTISDDEGKALRPDLIVSLPGGKKIVVDSKTPMNAYLDAVDAEDEESRLIALNRHAKQVHTHIKQLGGKAYQQQFEQSPEFVVLFLPSESFFSAALAQDAELIEAGVDQGVILATPTTLIALLKAVAYGWRQEALTENAQKISKLGRELHRRISTLTEHFIKIGNSLGGAVNNYNKAVGSLERNVITGARKFEELEAAAEKVKIESPRQIENQVRNLSTPDSLEPTEGFAIEEQALENETVSSLEPEEPFA